MPTTGIAVSSNGIDWVRGKGPVAGNRDDDRDLDVGEVLGCNPDWWTFDTRCVGVSDVQVTTMAMDTWPAVKCHDHCR